MDGNGVVLALKLTEGREEYDRKVSLNPKSSVALWVDNILALASEVLSGALWEE